MSPKFTPIPGTHAQENATGSAQTLAAAGVTLNPLVEAVAIQARGGDIHYTLDPQVPPTLSLGFILRESDPPLVLSAAEAQNFRFVGAAGAGQLELGQYSA
jgi:hypothetical protein